MPHSCLSRDRKSHRSPIFLILPSIMHPRVSNKNITAVDRTSVIVHNKMHPCLGVKIKDHSHLPRSSTNEVSRTSPHKDVPRQQLQLLRLPIGTVVVRSAGQRSPPLSCKNSLKLPSKRIIVITIPLELIHHQQHKFKKRNHRPFCSTTATTASVRILIIKNLLPSTLLSLPSK